MPSCDFLHYREPKPLPLPVHMLPAEKGREDVLQIFRRYAATRVLDCERDAVAGVPRRNDDPALRRMGDSVIDDIKEELLERDTISRYRKPAHISSYPHV